MSATAVPALDFTELLKDIPRGAWVALSEDHSRVVAYGSEMRDVLEEAETKGEHEPIIMRVPQASCALIL